MYRLVPIVLSFTSLPCLPVTDLPSYTKLTSDEVLHLQNRGFGPTVPSFYTTAEDSSVAASQDRVTYDDSYVYQNAIAGKQARQNLREQQQQQVVVQESRPLQQQFKKANKGAVEVEEEEEIEEPDRLSLLLPQTKFNCISKNTGYYADEELGCEVFHYCQDNARHSWICPDGFTFHQVHLICMPPGKDNICEKSSQYHFVNEYLYKPLNLEEYQQKPNTSLRYSERYYPDNYYQENYQGDSQINNHRHSQRVEQTVIPKHLLAEQSSRTTFRPETTLGQVFRTPNEVNIPLQQRRPIYNQRYITREEE